MSIKKEFKTVNLNEIIPYENNPRNNDEAVQYVIESINQCENLDPIEIDENNVILSGHTRLNALKKIGYTETDVIQYSGLSEEQKKKYRILANKTNEIATWDFEKLEKELADLDFEGFDFGFDGIEINEPEEHEVVEDEVPEDVETRCKLGDVWLMGGGHRLICGDSTDPAVIDRLMDGVKADLLLTDPPYGINVVSFDNKIGGDKPFGSQKTTLLKRGFQKKGKNKILDCNEYAPIIGDDTTETAKANYHVVLSCTKNQIIFGGNYFTDFLPPSRCWVVWDKQNTGNFADAELAWTSFERGVKLYHFLWNGLCREGSREVEGKTRMHPTQKPVGMLADILKDFSEENDSILDCFGGSGSTLIACEQLNRKCYICELDEHYCDVILNRWEKFTGKKAVLLND